MQMHLNANEYEQLFGVLMNMVYMNGCMCVCVTYFYTFFFPSLSLSVLFTRAQLISFGFLFVILRKVANNRTLLVFFCVLWLLLPKTKWTYKKKAIPFRHTEMNKLLVELFFLTVAVLIHINKYPNCNHFHRSFA